MKKCIKCGELKSLEHFVKCKKSIDGTRNKCKLCRSIYANLMYHKNNDKIREYCKALYKAHPERFAEYRKLDYLKNSKIRKEKGKIYVEKNKQKIKIKMREWQKNNKHKVNAACAKRYAMKVMAVPKWANNFYIEEIYDLARRRTEITGIKWHVDHIVPIKSSIVCGLHCEANMQVITAQENLAKRNSWWPDMP